MLGALDVGMAVAAIHPQLIDVDLVAERDGLYGTVADAAVFGRQIVPDPHNDQCSHYKNADPYFKR